MNDNPNSDRRVERVSRLGWVPIALMRVSPLAQRDLKKYRVEKLANAFDPEELGYPVVSRRDGLFYIIDGQHRVEMLKLIGYGDQQIQCEVYDGLTEADEARKFLNRDDQLAVSAFDRFKVAVVAGLPGPVAIDKIVRGCGLRVSHDNVDGSIQAVGALQRVYQRDGGENLGRTLTIIRDAYGASGLKASVIDGIGLVCHRYNDRLKDDKAIAQLSSAAGGVNALLGKANTLRKQTGATLPHCIAASAVEIINRGKGASLPSWWRSQDEQ